LGLASDSKKGKRVGNHEPVEEHVAPVGDRDLIVKGTDPVQEDGACGDGNVSNGVNPDNQSGEVLPIQSVHAELSCTLNDSLKSKIIEEKYIDLSLLLPSISSQGFESAESNKLVLNLAGELQVKKSRSQKIANMEAWTDAFIVYMSVYLSVHVNKTQELLKYMNTIRLGEKRIRGLGWKAYDEQFRYRMSVNPNNSWGKIDDELWLLFMFPQNQSFPSVTGQGSNANKCFDYNFRQCIRIICHYIHACLNCGYNHPSRLCQANRKFEGQTAGFKGLCEPLLPRVHRRERVTVSRFAVTV
jgi:hypothetical protein